MEQEQPDYDMDSEDERWMKDSKKRAGLEVTHLQFEEMIDRLEKSCGNQVKMLQIGFAFLSLSIPMIPEIKKSCGFVWWKDVSGLVASRYCHIIYPLHYYGLYSFEKYLPYMPGVGN